VGVPESYTEFRALPITIKRMVRTEICHVSKLYVVMAGQKREARLRARRPGHSSPWKKLFIKSDGYAGLSRIGTPKL
jgi:hypothetical protein